MHKLLLRKLFYRWKSIIMPSLPPQAYTNWDNFLTDKWRKMALIWEEWPAHNQVMLFPFYISISLHTLGLCLLKPVLGIDCLHCLFSVTLCCMTGYFDLVGSNFFPHFHVGVEIRLAYPSLLRPKRLWSVLLLVMLICASIFSSHSFLLR